jgi:hypothetical protein
VNSTGKVNSVVVKTLKPVLCSSRDGAPLNYKKHFAVIQFTNKDRLSLLFDPCKFSLDNTFK